MFKTLIAAVVFCTIFTTNSIGKKYSPIPLVTSSKPELVKFCNTDVIKLRLKELTFYLAMKPYRDNFEQISSADRAAKQQANQIGKATFVFLKKSHISITDISGHLKKPGMVFCSAVLRINGKPLTLSGNEHRNRLRFVAIDKFNTYIIDYDIFTFNIYDWPAPQRSING